MVWLNIKRQHRDSVAANRIQCDLIGTQHVADVYEWLRQCPSHRETPLVPLPALARRLGLAGVHVKAECNRMGLTSFKALGGGYAVARLVKQHVAAAPDRAVIQSLTVTCASAGNHGLAVAAAARNLGVRAVVYLSRAVPELFAERLQAQGATVVRSGATYEESMSNAAADAQRYAWHLVSDSSWPGYTDVPLQVMRGYTVILEEAALAMEAAGHIATHVFVQAGVGGLAGAAAAYLRDRWGDAFKLVVVEPEGAPCLLESATQGRLTRVAGAPTSLGRLDCKVPSLIAFDILSALADAFLVIPDTDAEDAALELTNHGVPVSACGAAGGAGLIAASQDDSTRRALDLNLDSHVLLIGTEGPQA